MGHITRSHATSSGPGGQMHSHEDNTNVNTPSFLIPLHSRFPQGNYPVQDSLVGNGTPDRHSTESNRSHYYVYQQLHYPYIPVDQRYPTRQKEHDQTPAPSRDQRGHRTPHLGTREPMVNINKTHPHTSAEWPLGETPAPRLPVQRGAMPRMTWFERIPIKNHPSQNMRPLPKPTNIPGCPSNRHLYSTANPSASSHTHGSGGPKQPIPRPGPAAPPQLNEQLSEPEPRISVPVVQENEILHTPRPPKSLLKRLKRLIGLSSGVTRREETKWSQTRTETWTVTRSTA
ncbi:hypothetical protein B0J17DRAFT_389358 [Rhizoctonia solani]|nr:hypothetical protein B0J17DRAFT_389358 [Rhizoctonia solani]